MIVALRARRAQILDCGVSEGAPGPSGAGDVPISCRSRDRMALVVQGTLSLNVGLRGERTVIMALSSRAVDSTGVAAISGAPLRPRHQVHAFTSRLSPRIGRSRTVQVRADNALIINAKGTTSEGTRECLDAQL